MQSLNRKSEGNLTLWKLHQRIALLTFDIGLFLESAYSTQTYETCSSVHTPLAFTARSNSLWINFKSSGKGSGNGFQIPFVTFECKSVYM